MVEYCFFLFLEKNVVGYLKEVILIVVSDIFVCVVGVLVKILEEYEIVRGCEKLGC